VSDVRTKMPRVRQGTTRKFQVGEFKAYLTVNVNEAGEPMEVFLDSGKEGSTTNGFLDTIAVLVSHSLQNGVPIDDICDSLVGMRYEPWGDTNDEDIRFAGSVSDYIGRRLALDFMEVEAALELLQRSSR
jgi:ribonucleoside-diphosphate reductase alpha chain